jgi:hemerythrin-like domain-containing protein
MEATMAATKTKRKAPAGTTMVKRYDGRRVRQPDALAFLMKQHREVEALFDRFEASEDDAEKAKLVDEVCLALAVHAKIEEELLYPPAEDAIEEADLVDEAYVEHATAKDLIAQLEGMKVGDQYYDAKVKVLSEYIAHHVEEEETELFPEIKRSEMDLTGLAEKFEARTEQLKADFGDPDSAGGKSKIKAEASAGAHL